MSWFTSLSDKKRYLVIAAAVIVVIAAIASIGSCLVPGRWISQAADGSRSQTITVPIRRAFRPKLAHASIVQRGEYLARAADCGSLPHR